MLIFVVKKVESITEEEEEDDAPPSVDPGSEISDSGSRNGLYGLIIIPVLAILIGIVVAVMRKYGCGLFLNFIGRISNHMLDINVDAHEDTSIRTPSAVNEALDNVSTEDYGNSSSISSLSWDSQIQIDADRISEVIEHNSILSERSSSNPSVPDQSRKMIDQQTQTTDQSEDIEMDETIGILDLDHPLSPMDLFPTFTADISIDSDSDNDLTIPKVLDFDQNFNLRIPDESEIQASSHSPSFTDDSVADSTNRTSDINTFSRTRSGLIYK